MIALPPEVGALLWEDCVPYLRRAAQEHPASSLDDMEEMRRSVIGGERMLIQVVEGLEVLAVALVEFVDLSDGRCLWVRYLSGSGLGCWVDELHSRLAEIGRAYGCAWVGLSGRVGWKRALGALGYEAVAIQMRAAI